MALLTNAVRWLWDFGDGTTSELQNPVHTYHYMPGVFTVRLQVWDELGNTARYVYEDFIRVYDYNYGASEVNASLTDKCYRLPVLKAHGFGPSEYKDGDLEGFDWIWPPAQTGVLKLFDEEKNEIGLAVDTKTQEIYWLNRPETLYDRMAGEYSANKRIIAEIHQRSVSAQNGDNIAIRHVESHLYINPEDRYRRNTSGFDEEGFMLETAIDVLLMKNEEPVIPLLEAENVPKDGDIVFYDQIEAREYQLRVKLYQAGWWFTGMKTLYTTIDKAGIPSNRLMSEETYLQNLNNLPLFRLQRSLTSMLNDGTGRTTGDIATFITGPDEREFSAYTATGDITDTLPASMNDDFAFLTWLRDAGTTTYPLDLLIVGNLTITLQQVGAVFQLVYDDTVNPAITVNLASDFTDWKMLAVIRNGTYINIYEGYSLLLSTAIVNVEDFGTTIRLLASGATMSFYDPTIVPRSLGVEELAFYYKDVTRNQANIVCRPF